MMMTTMTMMVMMNSILVGNAGMQYTEKLQLMEICADRCMCTD